MRIDWWTFGLQTINVLVLVWILARFLFRPVAAIVEARQAEAARLLDEARAAKVAAGAERQQLAAEAVRQASARGEILKAAAVEAEAEKSTILANAQAEADQVRSAAEAEIARARQGEAAAAADRASRLAVDITAKLLSRLPEESRVAGFIDGLAAGLAALPAATRAILGTPDAPLHLRTARPLTEAETEFCRAALVRALGRPVTMMVETDPGLIAGCEIETAHAVVRNSFRADLDRITKELTHDDRTGH